MRQEIRSVAAARPRFGYRRVHAILVADGYRVNHKRVQRLYRFTARNVFRSRGDEATSAVSVSAACEKLSRRRGHINAGTGLCQRIACRRSPLPCAHDRRRLLTILAPH
ncbi:MAG: IS3 family transposase [Vulcanimicrobiaceae bacterium]